MASNGPAEKYACFRFRHFVLRQQAAAMKVGTDSVLLGAWADVAGVHRALDAGAGTGVLSLMLAQRGVGTVDAVEIDPGASAEAAANVAGSPWPGAVRIICGDVTGASIGEGTYDLLISNPPYFAQGLHAPDPARASVRHEGSLTPASLFGLAARVLQPCGRVAIVMPFSRNDDVEWQAALAGFYPLRVCDVADSPRRPVKRRLWELARQCNAPVERSALFIRDTQGAHTPDFTALTKEFYL